VSARATPATVFRESPLRMMRSRICKLAARPRYVSSADRVKMNPIWLYDVCLAMTVCTSTLSQYPARNIFFCKEIDCRPPSSMIY
jgi:hypothetical protein